VKSIHVYPPPTVSVIIPTYNRAAILPATLDCVLAQRYPSLEVIVVDDGSADSTAAVVASYGERVRYLHHANRGLGPSRNRGIDAARGEFLVLPDDDDLWEPGFLQLSVALLQRFPRAALAFSNFWILRDGARLRGDGLRGWHPAADFTQLFGAPLRIATRELGADADGLPESLDVHECDIYAPSLYGPWVLPAAGVIRRSAIPPGLRFPEFDVTCSDWEFFARLSHHGGALLIAAEIAINRSHETPNRLTRLPQKLQIARRAAMIERLWRSDAAFMQAHGDAVNTVLHECLLDLARAQLFDGERQAARASLARALEISPGAASRRRSALRLASAVPGVGKLLGTLREWRHRRAI
jgi:glycosyltransferase involved in cell wall biosynthesis